MVLLEAREELFPHPGSVEVGVGAGVAWNGGGVRNQSGFSQAHSVLLYFLTPTHFRRGRGLSLCVFWMDGTARF